MLILGRLLENLDNQGFFIFTRGIFWVANTDTGLSPPVCFVGEYVPWGCVREVAIDYVQISVLFCHFLL